MIKECADDSRSRGTSYSERVERHVPERSCCDGMARPSRGMLLQVDCQCRHTPPQGEAVAEMKVGSNFGQRTVLLDETSHRHVFFVFLLVSVN